MHAEARSCRVCFLQLKSAEWPHIITLSLWQSSGGGGSEAGEELDGMSTPQMAPQVRRVPFGQHDLPAQATNSLVRVQRSASLVRFKAEVNPDHGLSSRFPDEIHVFLLSARLSPPLLLPSPLCRAAAEQNTAGKWSPGFQCQTMFSRSYSQKHSHMHQLQPSEEGRRICSMLLMTALVCVASSW